MIILIVLERKISMRSSKADLIQRGVLIAEKPNSSVTQFDKSKNENGKYLIYLLLN